MNPSNNKVQKSHDSWPGVINGSAVATSILMNKWDFHNLPVEFRNNKDVVLASVKRDPSIFKSVSPEFQNDPDIILVAIELGTPSFMGKAGDNDFLSRSLEAISRHPHLFNSVDLNFLYVSKCNFPILEMEVKSMGWYKKIFSDEAKHLKMMKGLYRERINIFMKRVQEDDKYQEKQTKEIRRKKEYENYLAFRADIEKMPIYERWRQDVFKKSDNRCQMCGTRDNLEIHHRISFYRLLRQNNITSTEQAFECKQLWNIDNGEALCKECHDKMESSKRRETLMSEK